MKNTIIWIVVILVLVLGFFWYTSQTDKDVMVEEESQSMTVVLEVQNDSGVSGSATLTEVDGNTLVELDLAGSPEGVAQPAHIHAGSCAEIGDVVYPLESAVGGLSETTLNVALATILEGLPLAINVHQSAEEVDIYVACGDLVAE